MQGSDKSHHGIRVMKGPKSAPAPCTQTSSSHPNNAASSQVMSCEAVCDTGYLPFNLKTNGQKATLDYFCEGRYTSTILEQEAEVECSQFPCAISSKSPSAVCTKPGDLSKEELGFSGPGV